MAAKLLISKDSAATFLETTKALFVKMCKANFSEPPTMVRKDILEYNGRMRVSGMEKFNGPTYISFINFYKTTKDMQDHKACGAVILYIEDYSVDKMLKALGFSGFDDEDEKAVADICGQFCSMIGDAFRSDLLSKGFIDLIISPPANYRNIVPAGVEFSFDQYEKHELSFSFWNQKVVVVDFSLCPVPGI